MSNILIRPSNIYDAGLYYLCRFDVDARIMSGSTDQVNYGSHLKWFRRKISTPISARYYTIILDNGEGIGYVRFDSIGGNKWEISIAIVPNVKHRRLGHATRALEAAINDMRKNIVDHKHTFFTLRPYCTTGYMNENQVEFIARTHPDNIAAKKVFVRLGFELIAIEYGFEIYRYSCDKKPPVAQGGCAEKKEEL